MKELVLFSCIGDTDPMNEKNLHDGPLLHIIRNYKPSQIYLYLSQDMLKHHREENRYQPYLDKMSEFLNLDYQVHYIERPDLDQPHIFDTFFDDMKGVLTAIQENHPQGRFIANISSGTPAMKSAILVLSSFLDVPLKTIQVSTPEVGTHITPEKVDRDWWEFNEDNEKEDNRCLEIKNTNFNKELKVDLIKRFIENYDYTSAYETAVSIKDLIDPKIIEYLIFQKYREDLNIDRGRKNLSRLKSRDVFDRKQSHLADLYEYFLRWQSQAKRGEYLMFITGISPLLANIQAQVLKKFSRGKIFLHPSGRYENSRFDEKASKILQGEKRGDFYTSHMVNRLIQELEYVPKEIQDLCKTLRQVESRVRNDAAHQIVCINKESIHQKTDLSIDEIINTAWQLLSFLDEGLTKTYRRAYDLINEKISEDL